MSKGEDGLTAKRRLTIERARRRRVAAGIAIPPVGPPGGIGGSGTANQIAKWTASTILGDSALLKDDGVNVSMKSVGALDVIFDTSNLSADTPIYFVDSDPATAPAVVTGLNNGSPGMLAQWSPAGYVTSIQESGISYNGATLDVPGTLLQVHDSAGVSVRALADGGNYVEMRAINGGGVNRLDAFGNGARWEMNGNTSAEVLRVNGKFAATGDSTFPANILQTVAGKGIRFREGANAIMGTAVLVGGTVVVNTAAVTANSRIQLTAQVLGTVAVPKALAVTARTPGTSFTITSADATDTSTIAWLIVEPS